MVVKFINIEKSFKTFIHIRNSKTQRIELLTYTYYLLFCCCKSELMSKIHCVLFIFMPLTYTLNRLSIY